MPRWGTFRLSFVLATWAVAWPTACRKSADLHLQPIDTLASNYTSPWDTDPAVVGLGPNRSAGDVIVVVQVQFDVLRVDLPAEPASHSPKIWNHVDETQIAPSQAALLSRNGLRAGVASASAWPALRALFESEQARVFRAQHRVADGVPLSLDLGTVDPGESVFVFHRDGRLTGTTFDRGTRFLHVDYQYRHGSDPRTTLQLTPEVRRQGISPQWNFQEGRFVNVSEDQGEWYSELSTTLNVPLGSFVVIGPDDTAENGYLVGRRFLTHRSDGLLYETLLCITPQPHQAERVQRNTQ